jgi:hypothetical protein
MAQLSAQPQSPIGPIDIDAANKLDSPEIWPTGLYRRVVKIEANGAVAMAGMTDDFHDFSVRLEHDGQSINHIDVEMRRLPWSTCSGAAEALQKLNGMPIIDGTAWLDATLRRQQCNHLLDLAQLAASAVLQHLGIGAPVCRTYEIDIARDQDEVRHARLRRDGATLLFLRLRAEGFNFDVIESPGPMRATRLSRLPKEITAGMTMAEREAYFLLRRAVHVSLGRWFKNDASLTPSQMGLEPTCYTFQPNQAKVARFNKTSVKDFTHNPQALSGK